MSFWAGNVYPLDGLWFVGVSVVVGRWYTRVLGVVVDKGGETRLPLSSLPGMRGWLCMWSARWEDEEDDDERW